MSRDTPLPRRTMLRGGTLGLLGALAGCTELGGDSQQTAGDDTQAPTGQASHGGNDDGHEHDEGEHDHDDEEHDHGNGHADELERPTHSAEVEMATEENGHHFKPHVVWIEEGGTVTWTLTSGSHSTTAYHETNDRPDRTPDGTDAWDSGVLSEEGATFDHRFETSGVYDYFCEPHESLGMVGTVLVGNPDVEGQPGLAPPQESLPEDARTAIEARNQQVVDALE